MASRGAASTPVRTGVASTAAPVSGFNDPMRSVWRILKRTVAEFQSDRCPEMAAAIAYHALFAVVPVVALLVAVLGWTLRDPRFEQQVIDQVLSWVPLRSGLVVDAITAVSRASEPLSILGGLALVWAATGLFGAIRGALNVAWGIQQNRSFFRAKLVDAGAVATVALLVVISIAGTGALHTIQSTTAARAGELPDLQWLWTLAGYGFPAAISYVAFLLVYRYFPATSHGFRDVWIGALAGAVLFELAKHGFTFYVARFSRYEVLYGALGAVMLFLLWIYVSASILLAGAELAAVYEQARRSRRASAGSAKSGGGTAAAVTSPRS